MSTVNAEIAAAPVFVSYQPQNLTGKRKVDTRIIAQALPSSLGNVTVRECAADLIAWAREGNNSREIITLSYDPRHSVLSVQQAGRKVAGMLLKPK